MLGFLFNRTQPIAAGAAAAIYPIPRGSPPPSPAPTMSCNGGSGFFFPETLLTLILLRSPVRSLVRFRSVCKTWDSLITSQSFISDHTARQSLQSRLHNGFPRTILKVEGSRWVSLWREDQSFEERLLIKFPTTISYKSYIISCCNGVISIACYRRLSPMQRVFLWNPLTGDCIKIPDRFEVFSNLSLGFGFDSITNDYKVVLAGLPRSSGHGEGRVYSLNESWMRSVPFSCILREDAKLSSGALFS